MGQTNILINQNKNLIRVEKGHFFSGLEQLTIYLRKILIFW